MLLPPDFNFLNPDFPGADLIEKGLQDLDNNIESVESLLVMIGAPRLTSLGLVFKPLQLPDHPEMCLYRLLCTIYPRNTHAEYNALIQRLIRYESALDLQAGRRMRGYV